MAAVTATVAAEPVPGAVAVRPENRVNGFDVFSLPRVGVDVPFSPDCVRDFPLDLRQIASAKPYAYVAGNPLNATDPSGLDSWGNDANASSSGPATPGCDLVAGNPASMSISVPVGMSIGSASMYSSGYNATVTTSLGSAQTAVGDYYPAPDINAISGPADSSINSNVLFSKGDKLMTPGEIGQLGLNPHDIKDGYGHGDLYKTPNGDIVVKPKGGAGPGIETGLNVNDPPSGRTAIGLLSGLN